VVVELELVAVTRVEGRLEVRMLDLDDETAVLLVAVFVGGAEVVPAKVLVLLLVVLLMLLLLSLLLLLVVRGGGTVTAPLPDGGKTTVAVMTECVGRTASSMPSHIVRALRKAASSASLGEQEPRSRSTMTHCRVPSLTVKPVDPKRWQRHCNEGRRPQGLSP
jgi:hypothetical protein